MAPSLNQTELSKVSVIIPTYNQWAMLGETLDSVFAQTLPPSEVIVVDDGSTDETFEKFSKDARLKYISQSNSGPSAARNCGLAACTGDFIVSVDHDDLLHPEYLERAMGAFEQFPQSQVVWLNFDTFGSEDVPDYLTASASSKVAGYLADFISPLRNGTDLILLPPEKSLLLFSQHGPLGNSSLVYRRKALRGWNPRFRLLDDLGAIINALTHAPCPMVIVCQSSWSKRIGLHNTGRLGSKLNQAVDDWEVLVNDYKQKIGRAALRYHRQTLADFYLALGYKSSIKGNLGEALLAFRKSFKTLPSVRPLWWMLRASARHGIHILGFKPN